MSARRGRLRYGLLLAVSMGCSDQTLPPLDPGPEPPEPTDGIYIANADGANLRRLVAGERPAWAPGGRQIAFQRFVQIHVIGIDGSEETKLATGYDAAWSPTGSRLAFASVEGISVMRVDGSEPEVTTLLRHHFREDIDPQWDLGVANPAWSPDGERIAFGHGGTGDGFGGFPPGDSMVPAQVFVMNADGSDPRRLTETQGVFEYDPSWSPDGSEIVFVSSEHGIVAVPAAGGTPRTIHPNAPDLVYSTPAWSPDGRSILFTTYSLEEEAIWVVAQEGGQPERLIENGRQSDWSPDGASIVFWRIEPQ